MSSQVKYSGKALNPHQLQSVKPFSAVQADNQDCVFMSSVRGSGKPRIKRLQYKISLACQRADCGIRWKSHWPNPFCCSACEGNKGHTPSCKKRRSTSDWTSPLDEAVNESRERSRSRPRRQSLSPIVRRNTRGRSRELARDRQIAINNERGRHEKSRQRKISNAREATLERARQRKKDSARSARYATKTSSLLGKYRIDRSRPGTQDNRRDKAQTQGMESSEEEPPPAPDSEIDVGTSDESSTDLCHESLADFQPGEAISTYLQEDEGQAEGGESSSSNTLQPPVIGDTLQGDNPIVLQEAKYVYQWRHDKGMLQDVDFAYRFGSSDEAFAEAGRAVAKAWSIVAVLASHGDELRRKAMPLLSASRQQGVTLHASHTDKGGVTFPFPELNQVECKLVDQKSVESWATLEEQGKAALTHVLVEIQQKFISTTKPYNDKSSWGNSIQRRAIEKGIKAEVITLRRAKSTWEELLMQSRRIGSPMS